MAIKSSAIKGYLRKIRRLIPSGGKEKKQIMETISQSVENYLEENPQADWDAFQAHFGTPEQITASYIDGMETEEVIRKFKKKRIIIGVVVGAVVVALVTWAICLIIALNQNEREVNGYLELDPIVEVDVSETEE